jgi:hypothetical protein
MDDKFNLILSGKDNFYKKLNDKKYHVLVVQNKLQIKFMSKKFKEFNNKHTIIGLDFEFKKISKDTKEIAITQINLENNLNDAYIFIFYPPNLNNKCMNRFIKLLCNKKIIKVIHGGESLDIPYIFDNLLKKNINKISNLIYNLYDTKFLCEYYHIDNKIINKCSIYNLLEEMKIIDKKNIDNLNKLENDIGEIHLVEFDINNLSDKLINYALYDVIYLPTLIKQFINKSSVYKYIIRDLTGIIYYYKKFKSDYYNNINQNINKLNNNFILYENDKINLIDIFYYYYYYKLHDHILVQLSEITYFRQFIELILKYIIYNHILNKYKVYLSYQIINDTNIDINYNNFLLNKKNIINLVFKI